MVVKSIHEMMGWDTGSERLAEVEIDREAKYIKTNAARLGEIGIKGRLSNLLEQTFDIKFPHEKVTKVGNNFTVMVTTSIKLTNFIRELKLTESQTKLLDDIEDNALAIASDDSIGGAKNLAYEMARGRLDELGFNTETTPRWAFYEMFGEVEVYDDYIESHGLEYMFMKKISSGIYQTYQLIGSADERRFILYTSVAKKLSEIKATMLDFLEQS